MLVDLGEAINIMTIETTQLLQLRMQVRPTPTVLELADHSTIKPEGVIDDLVISVDSWTYPADFVVLQPKTCLGGHSIILGIPWLGYPSSDRGLTGFFNFGSWLFNFPFRKFIHTPN
jgi:hypothetical protein